MTRTRVVVALLLSVAAVAAVTGPAGAASNRPPKLAHLDPGGDVDLRVDLPVTAVFVGLEEGPPPTGIHARRFSRAQPDTVVPHEAAARRAGEDAELGITFDVDVTTVFADEAFEDAFFGFLLDVGHGPFAPTPVQRDYSALPGAAARVTENLVLDATQVESWLIEHAPAMLGVDTTRPTVFFIDWYGRDDFHFHTYTPFTYQPEIDSFAPQWVRNHGSAWGGGVPDVAETPTTSLGRVWFLDVSAGPELWTWNFLLDVGDIDGDGLTDHRLPPVWEYGTDHWFRPFPDLSADLAMVTRYVAINLLFAPGPLYDPAMATHLLDDELRLDMNVFADDPTEPMETLVPDEVLRRLMALDPSRAFSSDLETRGFDAGLDHAYACSSPFVAVDRSTCAGDARSRDADVALRDLHEWLAANEAALLDDERGAVPVALFDVDARDARYAGASLEQSWNMVFDTPRLRRLGFSTTHTTAHEVGHHLGVRHPHDGYDSERDQSYSASADFWFARLGDESATAMSYTDSQVDFSQFDRDNLDRWLVATRLQAANDILEVVYDSPRASSAAAELRRADALAGDAISLLHEWSLRDASTVAFEAHRAVLAAAHRAGVDVSTLPGEERRGRGLGRDGHDDDRHRSDPDRDHGLVRGELLDARVEDAPRRR